MSVSRPGDRETVSEHEEEDSDEEDARAGQNVYGGASGGTGTGRRQDRERSSSGRRDRSASRERSVSPRSDRRSQASSAPARPSKVTLVKSRKSEGRKQKHLNVGNLYFFYSFFNVLHKELMSPVNIDLFWKQNMDCD